MIAVQYMCNHGNDDLVTDAARVSFDKEAENFGPHQNERLINFLAREKHTAPFTHPTVTFRCKAPIFMARQLAKHQVGGTWNEVSRRYVTTSPEFWKPDVFRASASDVKQGSSPDPHRRSDEFLEEYLDICIDAVAVYNKMVALGICTEQARAVLPRVQSQNGFGLVPCSSGHVSTSSAVRTTRKQRHVNLLTYSMSRCRRFTQYHGRH